jgi:hypothetical protein
MLALLSLLLLFLLDDCNKDLAVSLMEIDGWSPLAQKKKTSGCKNDHTNKEVLPPSQGLRLIFF